MCVRNAWIIIVEIIFMIIETVQWVGNMDIKFLIDGKEERNISGILPTEGSIVELKKDGRSKLYDVVLTRYVYNLKDQNEPESCMIHIKSVEVDDLDKIGVIDE